MGTFYDTLGVERTARAREITRAYRRDLQPPPVSRPAVVTPLRRPSSPPAAQTRPTAAATRARLQVPSARRATAALVLAVGSAVAIPVAFVLVGAAPVWLGLTALVALAGSSYARSVAHRQVDRLWRASARRGGDFPQESRERIRLAATVAVLASRIVVVAAFLAAALVTR